MVGFCRLRTLLYLAGFAGAAVNGVLKHLVSCIFFSVHFLSVWLPVATCSEFLCIDEGKDVVILTNRDRLSETLA
jgi:hypothetical protein